MPSVSRPSNAGNMAPGRGALLSCGYMSPSLVGSCELTRLCTRGGAGHTQDIDLGSRASACPCREPSLGFRSARHELQDPALWRLIGKFADILFSTLFLEAASSRNKSSG